MNSTCDQQGDGAKTIRVLSIDGGGMRGIYSAQYMEVLTQHYAENRGVARLDLGRGFDLIAGTSTGAIIACALAHCVPLQKVVRLYRERGAQIFPQKMPRGLCSFMLGRWSRPGHLSKGTFALRAALTDVFGPTTLKDVWNQRSVALAVPAVEMSRHRAWVFKTPHLHNSHRDDDYTLVDVCEAATAAPLFRSLAMLPHPHVDGHHVFADGGLWANNPVLVGLVDALEMSDPGDTVEIFCLGTCPRPSGEHIRKGELDRGLAQWKFGADAAVLALDAQAYAYNHMARMLSKHVNRRRCRIVRFPQGPVTEEVMKYLELDETSEQGMNALMSQAQTDANETLSKCRDSANEDGRLMALMLDELPAVEAGADSAITSNSNHPHRRNGEESQRARGASHAQLPR